MKSMSALIAVLVAGVFVCDSAAFGAAAGAGGGGGGGIAGGNAGATLVPQAGNAGGGGGGVTLGQAPGGAGGIPVPPGNGVGGGFNGGNGNGNGGGGGGIVPPPNVGGGGGGIAPPANIGGGNGGGNVGPGGAGLVPPNNPANAGIGIPVPQPGKPGLPPKAKVAGLDTSKFDKLAPDLKLTEEQSKKVADAKSKLLERVAALEKAQDNARMAYDYSMGAQEISETASKVVAAADACKNFNPNIAFDTAVWSILNDQQRNAYRDLRMKG